MLPTIRDEASDSTASAVSRLGMTLVELLVVIAIIGVLAGLLLPAVQQAREAARKVACQSNLRQLGIALAAYNQTHRTLPPGCFEWRPWNGSRQLRNFAWSAFLLPYLEQANVSDRIDYRKPYDDPVNISIGETDLSIFRCPTARFRFPDEKGRSDYGGLFGQRITTKSLTDNGVFIYKRAIKTSEIRDGLTNTLAVAEDTLGSDAQWINGRNVFEQSGGINDPQAWIGDNEIRSDHRTGAMVLFCCGRVTFLAFSLDKKTTTPLITRSGGEVVNVADQ